MAALITGIRIGRDGYKLLKPVIDELWQEEAVREHVHAVGEASKTEDALATGRATIALWRYLWRNHRGRIFQGLLRALGRSIGPRALLAALVRWMARLISAGTALTVEVGLLVIPLNRKIQKRGQSDGH